MSSSTITTTDLQHHFIVPMETNDSIYEANDDDDLDDQQKVNYEEENIFVVMRFIYIANLLRDGAQFFRWLRDIKLLSSSYTCPASAGCEMQLCAVSEKRTTDMQMWRCRKHGVWRSIRKNSFFASSHLSIRNIILMIYMWSRGYSLKCTVFETRINKSTVIQWYRKCRQLCSLFVANRGPIGGSGNTVEIDESCFGKIKYHRGSPRKSLWVFGAVVQGSECRDLILRAIEGPRSSENLLQIINTYIHKDSIIFSDKWKGYNNLSSQGYTHLTVVHKYQFKDYDTGCCTNTIEGIWASVKTHVGKGKRRYEDIQSYLDEYVWRRRAMSNPCLFMDFIHEIAKQFPPAKRDS